MTDWYTGMKPVCKNSVINFMWPAYCHCPPDVNVMWQGRCHCPFGTIQYNTSGVVTNIVLHYIADTTYPYFCTEKSKHIGRVGYVKAVCSLFI